ncbi:MAG: UPF0104 family protein, partial [Rubrivivax sp.]|nr:UPF0104 family protein [Rubrivivax sp.]
LPAAALAAGAWQRGRPFVLRGHRVVPPAARDAALLVALATASWSLAATVVWLLLDGRLPWWTVTAAMLLAAVAGVVTHVPAGLGVLETVVLATLGRAAPAAELLAALLAYRALYYLLPLAGALMGYAWLESRRGRGSDTAARACRRRPA